jgi:hypothetical protein
VNSLFITPRVQTELRLQREQRWKEEDEARKEQLQKKASSAFSARYLSVRVLARAGKARARNLRKTRGMVMLALVGS